MISYSYGRKIRFPILKKYPPLGWCMYCLTKKDGINLTNEHIIPFALEGKIILPKSSCESCQKIINEEFEQFVLRKQYATPRVKLGLRSRNKKQKPNSLQAITFDTQSDGRLPKNLVKAGGKLVEIPIKEHPLVIKSPVFKRAGLLTSSKSHDSFTIVGISFHSEGPALDAKVENRTIVSSILFVPDKFARFIAKIAHGAAVAEIGADNFIPFLPDLILGKTLNLYDYVGNPTSNTVKWNHRSRFLHSIYFLQDGELLIAYIGLFSKYKICQYEVVVGKLKKLLLDI